jgi:hypothetical protein
MHTKNCIVCGSLATSWTGHIVRYFRSKRQAFKILKALNEAKQIHSGKKKAVN